MLCYLRVFVACISRNTTTTVPACTSTYNTHPPFSPEYLRIYYLHEENFRRQFSFAPRPVLYGRLRFGVSHIILYHPLQQQQGEGMLLARLVSSVENFIASPTAYPWSAIPFLPFTAGMELIVLSDGMIVVRAACVALVVIFVRPGAEVSWVLTLKTGTMYSRLRWALSIREVGCSFKSSVELSFSLWIMR